MDQNLNWSLLHEFAKQLGEEGKDYKIHKKFISDRTSTHEEIVIEYGSRPKEPLLTKQPSSSSLMQRSHQPMGHPPGLEMILSLKSIILSLHQQQILTANNISNFLKSFSSV